MTVIVNTLLLVRRLGEARRRREGIGIKQERLRGSLPEWALAPLREVGLSKAEVAELTSNTAEADKQAALDQVGREIDRLNRDIEQLEDQLVQAPCPSLEEIHARLDMALTPLRAKTVSHSNDFFYDRGDARV